MSIEKSVSLYDIGQSYENIQELLEDDVESEQLKKVLDGLDDKFEEKAENIAKVIRHLDATETAISNEIDRLNSRKKTIKNNAQRLKEYLQFNMETIDKRKFDTSLFKFYTRKNRQTVQLEDGVMLPEEYYKVEEVKNINKDKLKEDLEGGKTIEGAYLHRTESLIIK